MYFNGTDTVNGYADAGFQPHKGNECKGGKGRVASIGSL